MNIYHGLALIVKIPIYIFSFCLMVTALTLVAVASAQHGIPPFLAAIIAGLSIVFAIIAHLI